MLTTEEKMYINSELALHGKKTWVAVVLGIFLGEFGAHNFYIGDTSKAKKQLIIGLIGLFTTIILIGSFILFAMWVWAIIDLLTISEKVEAGNQKLKQQIIQDMKATA